MAAIQENACLWLGSSWAVMSVYSTQRGAFRNQRAITNPVNTKPSSATQDPLLAPEARTADGSIYQSFSGGKSQNQAKLTREDEFYLNFKFHHHNKGDLLNNFILSIPVDKNKCLRIINWVYTFKQPMLAFWQFLDIHKW